MHTAKSNIKAKAQAELNTTRKPSCRKETARCRSCTYRFKVRHAYKFNSGQASKAHASELQTYWRKTEFNANVD